MTNDELLDKLTGIYPRPFLEALAFWPDLSHVDALPDGDGVLGHLPISGLCSRCGEPHDNWTHHRHGLLCSECWEATCGDLPPCAFGPVQMPDNETLSKLVSDANVREEE